MVSFLFSATTYGMEVTIVEVEINVKRGIKPKFDIVGLPDKALKEATSRIPVAIRDSNFSFKSEKIVCNLAPAKVPKNGSNFDLAIAIGYLHNTNQVNFTPKNKLFLGELSLTGELRPISGVLPIIHEAKRLGFTDFFISKENFQEASLIDGVNLYPFKDLKGVVNFLEGKGSPLDLKYETEVKEYSHQDDFKDIRGQSFAKRGAEIAAAGFHNILLNGTPGSGKTLLAKSIPSILPAISTEESLEVTKIYSLGGLIDKDAPLVKSRPFRSPHHSASFASIVGGGTIPKPGEVTLAHNGVLFLDELPEFSSRTIESLREPLENRYITISRINGFCNFPAKFILVAAQNPCKCGFFGDPIKKCSCNYNEVLNYSKKISGPILDRIDLNIKVNPVSFDDLTKKRGDEEPSSIIRKRVILAQSIQLERFRGSKTKFNSEMSNVEVDKFINLDDKSKELLRNAVYKFNLSARAYYRTLKVAQTITDLKQKDSVGIDEISEALVYRFRL